MKKKTGWWKKASRKKKVLTIFVFLAGIGVISVGVYFVKGRTMGQAVAQEMSVQETQAKTGTISDTIVGTGNLENTEGEEVTIPSGIVIEEVKVESGDQVSKGDVLAVVDKTSVLSAMESIQEEIDALDEEIDESKDDSDTQSVTSKVDGRVKKIYVEEGKDVSDVMVEQGAVMLLSIDGYMAVEIETNADIAKGDIVTVTLSDGTAKEGTVESIAEGKCVVLFGDSSAALEENVTVTDTEGNALGNGAAYIHQQLAVTASAGTVEEICVSENDKVYTGTPLLTIDNGGQSLEYQEQMAERQELTEQLQQLITLSQSGTITAETDGIIQDVNVSAASSTGTSGTSSGSSQNAGASNVAYESSQDVETAQVSKNTVLVVGSTQENSENTEDKSAETGDKPAENEDKPAENEKDAKKKALSLKIEDSGKASQSVLVVETPETGKKPQTKISTGDGSYTGTISWKPEEKEFAAETSYQAVITLTAGEGYSFTGDSISEVKSGVLSGVTVSEDGKALSFQITYPFTAAEKKEGESGNNSGNGTDTQNGNDSGNGINAQNGNQSGSDAGIQKDSGTETNQTGVQATETSGQGSGSQTGATVTASTTSSQSSSQSSSASTTNADTSSNEVTAFTLAAADTMVLSVNVDELDINSVEKDQEAEITLDAIEDETFTGTVTKVGNSASSSSSGVAKYTVEITIPRDERMKAGMNASATITIDERENVVTIPVNALQERRNQVFVYTEKDSEGNLSGEQEVTTGLSDGDTVEITEGLSEGDTVYYQKTGNVSSQGMQQGFEKGNRDGNMGEMPQGDFRGGESGSGMPGGGMPSGMPGGGQE